MKHYNLVAPTERIEELQDKDGEWCRAADVRALLLKLNEQTENAFQNIDWGIPEETDR